MQIFFNFDLAELKNFIQQTAKYQKVMLVYDDTASSGQIQAIYEEIKSLCVFNKCYFNALNEEIYNGYKAVIFVCNANSFLTLNLSFCEFNCAFLPTDKNITCFLTNATNNNIIFLNSNSFDISLVTSVLFNKLFDYLTELSAGMNASFILPELNSVTLNGVLNFFYSANVSKFIDLQILKTENIEYEYLAVLDYILINALKMLFNNFLANKIEYVDFYKSIRNNPQQIDRFYALSCNNTLKLTMEYNYNDIELLFEKLDNILNKIKYCFFKTDKQKINEILTKLKNYTKNCNNLLANLYLFNFFGV